MSSRRIRVFFVHERPLGMVLSLKHFELNGMPKAVPLSLPYQDFKKDISDSKEMLRVPHRVKRVDFCSLVLPAMHAPEPHIIIGRKAPREEEEEEVEFLVEDIELQSGSSSDVSQKSTEHSQEGAPSTLLADDQKDSRGRASTAENDLELEEGSKTLVLFSPGDVKRSPVTHELMPEVDVGTLAALTPQAERPQPMGSQLDVSEPGTLSSILKSEPKPVTPGAASCPFTKVERTFIHIAEKTHLNVMSSMGQLIRAEEHYGPGQFEEPIIEEEIEDYELLRENGSINSAVEVGEIDSCAVSASHAELCTETQADLKPVNGAGEPKEQQESEIVDIVHREEPETQHEKIVNATDRLKGSEEGTSKCAARPPGPRFRSRIPVFLSEEDTGSDQSMSHSAKERFQKRTKQLDLARLVMEKRQIRLQRLASAGSSSASSGDDRRKTSETLSTTGSEEDTDDSTPRKSGREKADLLSNSRSKIPRPVTPVKSSRSAVPPAANGKGPSAPSRYHFLGASLAGVTGLSPDLKPKALHMRLPPLSSPTPARNNVRRLSRGPPKSPVPPPRTLSASPQSQTLSRTQSPSPSRQRRPTASAPRANPSPRIQSRAQVPGEGPATPAVVRKGQRLRVQVPSAATKSRQGGSGGGAEGR